MGRLAEKMQEYIVGGDVGILRHDTLHWDGGHPEARRTGSCWCNDQPYCMCTPSLAIDLIIASGHDHVWLVRRKDTNQFATMGGFVQVGETIEQAVKRELMEEMGIELSTAPSLLGVYSDPHRDNRRHTASAVFAVHLDGSEKPVASDDVKGVVRVPLEDIEKYDFFADHRTFFQDYRKIKKEEGKARPVQIHHTDKDDVARSLCTTLEVVAHPVSPTIS